MKYLQPTFTLPTSTARISQEEYEIRVGLRCPQCRQLLTARHTCPKEKSNG